MSAAHDLEQADLTVSVQDDPAFMAIVDPDRYAIDLPDWELDSLAAAMLAEMAAGRALAWGCPEDRLRVRVTRQPLDADARAGVVATIDGVIDTAGRLCLAGYTSITMCAQFAGKRRLPQPDDVAFTVAPGRYHVAVHRRYEQPVGGEPAALPAGGDHLILVLLPSADAPSAPSTIPWTPWPAR